MRHFMYNTTCDHHFCGKREATITWHRVCSRNWLMRVKWAPFCNFRGTFFERRGPPKGIWTYWYRLLTGKRIGLAERFAAILKHSGQVKKPGLELLQNPGCLSGETMTQTKKRKTIEQEVMKNQSKFVERLSNQCCCQWCFRILYF